MMGLGTRPGEDASADDYWLPAARDGGEHDKARGLREDDCNDAQADVDIRLGWEGKNVTPVG